MKSLTLKAINKLHDEVAELTIRSIKEKKTNMWLYQEVNKLVNDFDTTLINKDIENTNKRIEEYFKEIYDFE